MRCAPFSFVLFAFCLTLLQDSRARAEDGSPQYREVIASALEEYELGNFHEAMSLFERAHRIEPSARTYRGMGLASYQARNYVIAIGYLQAALEDSRKPLTPQFRTEVAKALEAARGFIAIFVLVVEPAEAVLTIDGESVAARGDGSIPLDPGEHEIVASARGYRSEARRIKATPGRSGRIELKLTRELSVVASAPTSREAEPAGTERSPSSAAPARVPAAYRGLAIGGLALALGGGVLGTVAGVKALSSEDRLAELCPDKTCGDEQRGRLSDAKRWGTVSTVSLAVGGVGLAAGVVGLVLWLRHGRREDSSHARARLTPLIDRSGVGLSGTF